MSSNLKAMIEQQNFDDVLRPYGDIIGNFLQSRYPGSDRLSSTTWLTKHRGSPIALDNATYVALCSWTHLNRSCCYTRHLLICMKLSRGNIVYQPFTESSGNSHILFRPRGSTVPIPGRIELILQEPNEAIGILNQARIVLLARAFQELSPKNREQDPYATNAIVGRSRFGIMGLYYEAVDEKVAHIIEPDDVVSHIAVSKFEDTVTKMSAPCIVVVDLDMVSRLLWHTFHIIIVFPETYIAFLILDSKR